METSKNPLGYEPVGKLLRKFAVPSIISMVVSTLYNIVDQIFIGRGVGYLGNGATNVILPLTVIALALGLMIGDGTTAYFSLCLGQKDTRSAAQGVGNAITLTVTVSIVLTVASLLFLKPLCILFGATDATMPYALEYGYIIVLGFPFYAFGMGFNSILRADGSPVYAMVATLSGAILNTILDPIFIFVFQMGVTGAAIATVLGQIVSCIITLLYLRKFKCIILTKDCLRIQGKLCRKLCSLGVSSFVMQLAATIVITAMNNVLVKYGAVSKYGSEIPMTTLGITMKVNQIITGIVIGIAVGSQPIIGYNYGAGKAGRAKKAYFFAIICSTVVMGMGTVLFQLFPHSIISIFGSESALYNEFAVKSLRIFLLLIVLNGFQLCTGVFFQAIGKPAQATLISLSRQVLFLLPALLILPHFFGVEGALWAGPVGDACAFVLAVSFGAAELRKSSHTAMLPDIRE